MAYIPLRKAVAELGLHSNTLRRYADAGIIQTIRNAAGQRLFAVGAYLRQAADASVVLYARVSSAKQRNDLVRQIERLRLAYPHAEVIQDIGGGLNFKRKGLQTLLERLLRGDKLRIVVAHRDRLARFGFDLFGFLVARNGGEIMFQSTRFLLDRFDLILLPTFATKMSIKSRCKIRSKSVWAMLGYAFFRFGQRLEAAARRVGKVVLRVNEAYTSKTASWTGEIKQIGGAKTITSGGKTVDRDHNGARGIFLRALVDTPSLNHERACVDAC
jgi:predicted site-specific integrase-resolvase